MPVYGEALPTTAISKGYLRQSYAWANPVPLRPDEPLSGTDMYPTSEAARAAAKAAYEQKLATQAQMAQAVTAGVVYLAPAFASEKTVA